ncbi:efflux RND transporter periplasmic adaptor subunit [Ciceribacter ferrooxidans]|uniref:Efflux RND transporter periplasmic adaptor subunit n=1 Tax=Ciceribacter ferrooxidans TaxID=2509717 RepID=A0A4Q2SZL7_9HYPH|nr:efflux RND transporter periplasmic adaptor subunit [Ciceribacter ferrooxidans]RYC11695.1 efflux RND transporter periplasmic adaptor subunit [Ciceribacter ferrooxidans]
MPQTSARAPERARWDRRFGAAPTLAALSVLALTACDAGNKQATADAAHVRVEAATVTSDVVRASATGEIKARVESDLSFKISGRVISRTAGVGDHVMAGQVLATLDPTEQKADLESARAAVASQEATLRMTSSVLTRRKALTQTGAMSQQNLDSALQQYQSAGKDLEAARAKLETAIEALQQTELRADADGTITDRDVETGQVVQASTTVFTLAHDGERDAVFNVQESAISRTVPQSMEVALLSRPDVKAQATPREVSPALDRSLGTVRVKLAISNPPAEMTLGSAIIANVVLARRERVSIPWQSMFSKAGKPAVWVVDPDTKITRMKPVIIERYDASRVVLSGGLQAGELIVVEGGQFLRENQSVSYTEESTR